MPERQRPGRRTFGPVVLVGLAAAGLGALAGTKQWASDSSGHVVVAAVEEAGRQPLAGALALVLLACWGVLLVTRRRTRRAVAGLGLLAALGVLATAVVGLTGAADRVRQAARDSPMAGQSLEVHTTIWPWLAGVAAVVSVAATVLALRWAPDWPEMGARYDAPGSATDPDGDPGARQESIDLWKSMDEGHDPTD